LASSFGHTHLAGGDEAKVRFYFLYSKISTFVHSRPVFKIWQFKENAK